MGVGSTWLLGYRSHPCIKYSTYFSTTLPKGSLYMQTNYCMAHTVQIPRAMQHRAGMCRIQLHKQHRTGIARHYSQSQSYSSCVARRGQCNLIRASRVIAHFYCLGPCASGRKTGEHKARVWRDDPIEAVPAVDQTPFVEQIEQIEQMDHKDHKWTSIRYLL